MGSTLDLTGYKLTFDDEFNSFSWNSNGQPGYNTWQTNFYFGGRSLPSNGEQETYSDPSTGTNPFSITPSGDIAGHSQLDIQAKPAAGGGYTSGLITTEPSFSQTYGYFEMRAELPAGKGLWPAFWLLPADKSWPPEIDALEAFGAPNANGEGIGNEAHVGVISGNGSENAGGWQPVNGDITTGYHNYGVMWDPQHITWYIDGQEVFQTATPADANKPMYLLANLAVGGNWPGGPDGTTGWPADLKVDYIHAYSSDPNAQAVTPQPGYSGPGLAPTASGSSAADPAESNIAHPYAQPTPDVARNVVTADDSGTATGGSGPSVLVATAAHQTLAGHGGEDVFNIGNNTDAALSEGGQGVSTVITSAPAYTLPTGIDNLAGNGAGAQTLTGNGGNNTITGNDSNNVINGGGGNATIKVGTGANMLTGGGTHDLFVFPDAADHDNVVTDFKPGADELDLTGVLKAAGYQGQDPVADHVLNLVQNGSDTAIVVDPHANGDASAHTVVTLANVVASSLKAGHDFIWHA